MENDPNKLYSYLSILALFALILALVLLNTFFDGANWLDIANSVLGNLISSLLILLVLYFLLRKRFFEPELPTPIDQSKINEVTSLVRDETGEIDNTLNSIKEKIDELLNSKGGSVWMDYFNILSQLRGSWIEFIERRIEKDCEFSICQFKLDDDDKHEFSGTNYNTLSGDINYSWRTRKVLPPVRINNDTIYIYYIYQRHNNQEYDGKYGFGRLVAERTTNGSEEYSFTHGFFFNEAKPDGEDGGYFPMKLRRLESVASMVNLELDAHEYDQALRVKLFKTLKETPIHQKW